MRPWMIAAIALAMALANPAAAAERAHTDDVYAAAKSAHIEALRLRLPQRPTATTTLLEAQEALRRYREANPERKGESRAILDAAMARLELEANQR